MAKQREKARALALRRQGQSIGEIAKLLDVSKSTVSGWCRDITLTEKQIGCIAKRSNYRAVEALLKAAEKRRLRRSQDIRTMTQGGKEDVGAVSERDTFMVGLGLYWGEGYKKGNQELGFTNSDADMIIFYIRWLKEMYSVEDRDFILRVSINEAHAHRIKTVEKYWSQTLSLPLSQFTKSSLIKARVSKQHENTEKYFGTLRVKVRRGTNLRRRILGSIEKLRT